MNPVQVSHSAPSWAGNEYSSMSPFNSDNGRLLLIHGEGRFGLYDVSNPDRPSFIRMLPILASEEPRWSRSNKNLLYTTSYGNPNQLFSYDISSGVKLSIRTFSEYTKISGHGESDISYDGDHMVFSGIRPDGSTDVFIYTISTNTKTFLVQSPQIDGLKITPSNAAILSNDSGIFLLRQSSSTRITNANGHADVGRDSSGDDIIVWTNSADKQPLAGCQNGITKVRVSDGKHTCLLSLDWSLAVHISLSDRSDWCLVSTYAPTDKGAKYTNQILKVALDGSGVEVLQDHGSKPLNSYNYTPKASLSNDGTRYVYSSNMGQIPSGATKEYIDAYLVVMSSQSVPVPTPTPSPVGDVRINYAAYVGKSQFVIRMRDGLTMRPRTDGGVDLSGVADVFEVKV